MKSIAIRLVTGAALVAAASWAVHTQDRQDGDKPAAPAGLILDKAETIEFTTDEGTWMSLDVSPDGRTIAFDLLGDLYTLPIDGGTATRIAGGMSFDSQPKFSPDGKTIAFVSDRSGVENLWIANADGSNPRAVTKDRPTQDRPEDMLSPSWTADGQYLLVSKSRAPEPTFAVFLYDKDGGTGLRIGSPPPPQQPQGEGSGPPRPAPNRMGAVASPDGKFIYYAERMGNFTYNARFPIWQIIRFDRETGDTATITNAQGSAMRPVISPDGKSLVFATRFETGTGLRIRNLETGDERWLIYPVTRDDQESRASRDTMPGYAFLPDGQSLVVADRRPHPPRRRRQRPLDARPVHREGPGRHRAASAVREQGGRWSGGAGETDSLAGDFARRHARRLQLAESPLDHGCAERPAAAVDEPRTRANSCRPGRPMGATWRSSPGRAKAATCSRVAAAPGSQPEQLSRYAAYYPSRSSHPTARRSSTSPARGPISCTPICATSPPVTATSSRTTRRQEIGGIRETADMDLRWIPASGGDSTLIASAQGGASPHFANDSVHIYLTGRRGLSSIRIDGFDRRQLVEITGAGAGINPPQASEIRVSPDGRQAFVSLQNKHVIVGLPRAGKEPIEDEHQGQGRLGRAGEAAVARGRRLSLVDPRRQGGRVGARFDDLSSGAQRRDARDDRRRSSKLPRAAERIDRPHRRAHRDDERRGE